MLVVLQVNQTGLVTPTAAAYQKDGTGRGSSSAMMGCGTGLPCHADAMIRGHCARSARWPETMRHRELFRRQSTAMGVPRGGAVGARHRFLYLGAVRGWGSGGWLPGPFPLVASKTHQDCFLSDGVVAHLPCASVRSSVHRGQG